MGIDIRAQWKGQTAENVQAQGEAWLSNDGGKVGYLREAYHGEPYATSHLVAEAFEHPDGVRIPASVLRTRLPETLKLAERREREIYRETHRSEIELVLDNYRAFVELCEQKEEETGEPVKFVASW